jgi:hypothetical protein
LNTFLKMIFISGPNILLDSSIIHKRTHLIYVLTQQLNFQNRTRWMYLKNIWNTMEFAHIIRIIFGCIN